MARTSSKEKGKEKEGSTPKAAATTKKGKKSDAVQAPDAVEEAIKLASTKIDWSDNDLTDSIIATITQSRDIKAGLFPGCGATPSTANGGGKKKSDWYWEVAMAVFPTYNPYKDAITPAVKIVQAPDGRGKSVTKLRTMWGDKIKNRLEKMKTVTLAAFSELGETGQGIRRRADVDWTLKSDVTNKFVEIEAAIPYYWEMLELIGDSPNRIKTGTGNSTTTIDVEVLQSKPSTPVQEECPSSNHHSEVDDDDEESDDSMLPANPGVGVATKHKRDNKTPTKSEPVKSNSTPAPKSTRKKGKFDEFATIAHAEEETRQKELEVAKMKLTTNAKLKLELETKGMEKKSEVERLKLEKKAEKQRMKHEEKMLKLQHAHQLRMAVMGQGQNQFNSGLSQVTGYGYPSSSQSFPHASSSSVQHSSTPTFNFDSLDNSDALPPSIYFPKSGAELDKDHSSFN